MSQHLLRVHYLPGFVAESDLAGGTVVVIDLLRASTTIATALAAGAVDVRAFVDVGEALAAGEAAGRDTVVLGGEREGKLIEGFDLGNSPLEYMPDTVAGRHVLFTTTNGTRALNHARLAGRVVIGAMVNLSAVAASVGDDAQVDLLCAGTNGHVTREDILTAGAIVDRLTSAADQSWQTNESADAALGEWQELVTTARATGRSLDEQLAEELRNTPGGRNLLAIGYDADLVACAQIDLLDVVPELDRDTGRICLP